MAVDPADSTANTVYVGGAYGGVWKSSNAASTSPADVTWTPLMDDQATLAVGAIAVQPQLANPDPARSVIVVGTGESNSSADSYYGLGLLRSADAGATWTLISSDSTGTRSFAGMGFSRIAFHTSIPSVVVAAAAGASQGIIEGLADPVTANLGLYSSSDGGASWNYATVKDGTVVVDPGSATGVVFNSGAGRFFAALRYHGFYSSSDGTSWTRLTNQPGGGLSTSACPPNPHSASCPIYRGELAVVPARNEMYVWYVDGGGTDQGIWKTTNGGNTWAQLNESGISNCGDATGCGTHQGIYNLALAAVPDGAATDLYAGAANLYKCQITSAAASCAGSGPNTFLNLTHVYGCSAIARVHPAQHALSFLLSNGNTQAVMYFANDGGVYRALDGYSGLTTGDCGGSNQFDSLNQTIGSMAQFVAFSQPPADANTILGGTQGNGSPATQSALVNSSWLNVNAGDGGFNAINPDNADEWFVSNPADAISGVNIFRCTAGINCHAQDFQNDQVISSATLGGDTGGYYPPFLLDPQNSGELIVGTCRVWRGTSAGSGMSLLSRNFETGGSGICTGGETNLVRALAAGGPLDGNGRSNVIYAGTDGFGPLISTIPPGGHVWVSMNAAGGNSTWVDRTAGINPNAFPISAIALDSSDPSGLTAYVSVMGFHTPHVWKTDDGGASWSDFTANLPDAPADALLVDAGSTPLNGMVYVGTDVGVFSSFTGSANWTEVPAPGSGQQPLPNVAVTALHMFSNGSAKLLRASTYGRGVWQFPVTPTFVPSVANTPLTVFPGQLPAQFNGAVLFYGYSNAVDLTCVPPSQATCLVTPTRVTAAAPTFTISASGPVGTSPFTLQGVGTDPNHLTGDAPFTLNVVDFDLGPLSPNHVTVAPGDTSAPIRFQVTASGPFSETVDLSCAGLPGGTTCNFLPSGLIVPTSDKPVNVTLSVATAPNTAAGTVPVTVGGSVTNGPTKTQILTLTVTKDYSVAIKNSSLTALENTNATFEGTLTALNGYNNLVNLSCGPGAPPTCTAAPATVTPSAGGTPFTVTVSSNQCGQYDFTIVAEGTDPLATTHSTAVTFRSTSLAAPDYTLGIDNPSLTASLNEPATFNGRLTATACYNFPVQLSCGSGAPPTCTASPAIVVPTLGGAPFTVKVSSSKAKEYDFGISGQGGDPLAIQHVVIVSFIADPPPGFDFSLTNTSGGEAITAGDQATFNLAVTPQSGKFPDNVNLTVADCPPLSTCTLSPAQVGSGKGATSVRLAVQTSAAIAKLHRQFWRQAFFAFWFLSGLLWMTGNGAGNRWMRRFAIFLAFVLVLSPLVILLGCGGGGLQGNGSVAAAQPGTPAGVYTTTVTATMTAAPGSPTKTVFVTLTVN